MARQTMIPMKVIAKKAGCSRSHVITFMKRLGVEHVGAMGNQYYYTITDAESVIAKIREEKGKKRAPVRSRTPAQKGGGEVVALLQRIAEGIDALVAARRRPAKGNHVSEKNAPEREAAEGRMMEFLADKQLAKNQDIFEAMHPGHRFRRKAIEKRPGGGRHAVWYQQ